MLAVAFVGVSFGAIAVASGLPAWAVLAFSACVFAGGSQFLAVGLVAAGNPVAAILSAALMLDFLGDGDLAEKIRKACADPVSGSTREVGSTIAARVGD